MCIAYPVCSLCFQWHHQSLFLFLRIFKTLQQASSVYCLIQPTQVKKVFFSSCMFLLCFSCRSSSAVIWFEDIFYLSKGKVVLLFVFPSLSPQNIVENVMVIWFYFTEHTSLGVGEEGIENMSYSHILVFSRVPGIYHKLRGRIKHCLIRA